MSLYYPTRLREAAANNPDDAGWMRGLAETLERLAEHLAVEQGDTGRDIAKWALSRKHIRELNTLLTREME